MMFFLTNVNCDLHVLSRGFTLVDTRPPSVPATSPTAGDVRHVQTVQLYHSDRPLCGQWGDFPGGKGTASPKLASSIFNLKK